jgi:hypothetical protein
MTCEIPCLPASNPAGDRYEPASTPDTNNGLQPQRITVRRNDTRTTLPGNDIQQQSGSLTFDGYANSTRARSRKRHPAENRITRIRPITGPDRCTQPETHSSRQQDPVTVQALKQRDWRRGRKVNVNHATAAECR